MTNEAMHAALQASSVLMRMMANHIANGAPRPRDANERLRQWAGQLEQMRDELINRDAANRTLMSTFDNWRKVQQDASGDAPERVNDSTPNTRSVQWGHNGITFLDRRDIVAVVRFPTGPQGPIDGLIGSPERKRWQDTCTAWREHATLPDGAYFPRGLTRGTYSKQFNLAVL